MEIQELQEKLVQIESDLGLVEKELDVHYNAIAGLKEESEYLEQARNRILSAMAQLKGIDTEYSVRDRSTAQRDQSSTQSDSPGDGTKGSDV